VLRSDFPRDVQDLCRAVLAGQRPRAPAPTPTEPTDDLGL
jgi:hypothetical protein